MRLVLVVGLVTASMETKKKILGHMDKFNRDSVCWGMDNAMGWHVMLKNAIEECSMYNPIQTLPQPIGNNPFTKPTNPFQTLPNPVGDNPFTKPTNPFTTLPQPTPNNPFHTSKVVKNPWAALVKHQPTHHNPEAQNYQNLKSIWASLLNHRSKRGAGPSNGLLDVDEEDFKEFLEDFADFKSEMMTKMSNLTCVLTKTNLLDSNLQVNLAAYTEDMWRMMDLSQSLAGEDIVWRERMIQGFKDCHSIAESWPASALNRNPVTKIFGRHMVFFKCAKKVELKLCSAAQLDAWMTTMYGDNQYDYSQFGLPQDRYDRAVLATLVMYEQSSPEEEFVGEFFYGGSGM